MTTKELYKLATKYANNECSPLEKEAVEKFFQGMQEVQRDPLKGFPDENRKKILYNILQKINNPGRRRKSLLYRTTSIAALLVAVVSMAFFGSLFFLNSRNIITTEITGKAERKEIHLKDGSTVYLNSNSSITYQDDFQQERKIKLIGEAFFDVKPNPEKPFRVTTGDVETRVLGTSFNINAYQSNNIDISVNTGKVEVSRGEGLDKVQIKKNQQVNFTDGQPPVITSGRAQDLYAWRNNVIVLNKTSLGETAQILENWYDIQISFEEEALKNLTISGKFKDEKLESVLESIAFIKQLEFKYVNQKHIVMRKKQK